MAAEGILCDLAPGPLPHWGNPMYADTPYVIYKLKHPCQLCVIYILHVYVKYIALCQVDTYIYIQLYIIDRQQAHMRTAWFKVKYSYNKQVPCSINSYSSENYIRASIQIRTASPVINSKGSCLAQLQVQLRVQQLVCMACSCVWWSVHHECIELLIESVRIFSEKFKVHRIEASQWVMAPLSSRPGEM